MQLLCTAKQFGPLPKDVEYQARRASFEVALLHRLRLALPRGLVPVEARLKANSCAPSCPRSFASRGLCPREAKEEKERKEKEDAAT